MMSDLHPEHLTDLQKSGLSDQTLSQLAIQSVNPHRLQKLGSKYNAVSSAYEISYWDPDGNRNGFSRLKLFPPLKDAKGHTIKYYQPPGSDPHLYLPPLVDWRLTASDPSIFVYITEGEKKAASFCQHGKPCIGIGGVWNWRVKIDSGERLDCPELDQFIWRARQVEIIPDSDAWTKDKLFDILGGVFALGMALIQRGAHVQFVKLPDTSGIKVGLDDWLVREGSLWGHVWYKLERISLDDPRLHKLAGWWQRWTRRQEEPTIMLRKVFPLTDYGNAERLVALHGDFIRYCHPWKKWLVWNGQQWIVDDTEEIVRLAKTTVRGIVNEAEKIEDKEDRKKVIRHSLQSEATPRLRGMIHLAESEAKIPVAPTELDNEPMLLNCRNGTVDLRTGELLPHDRRKLITKLAPVDFDANATAPLWEIFLCRIMQERQDLVDFLQRAIGYGLTGQANEQILFILYGTGANGKSTFLETIRTCLGDYAQQADFSTFLAKKQNAIPNDLARLVGVRLVTATECQEGKKLDEALVKQVTGGDKITARFLHQEFFEFTPTLKLFLATNHKPNIKGTDHAIWRRIRLIPFVETIPEEEQDKELKQKLSEEDQGILNWAIQGCLKWQSHGLGMPDDVKNATQSYRDEMDTLGGFLADCCIQEPQSFVPSKGLYESYKKWCVENGENPISQKALGLCLKERGLIDDRKANRRGWWGIGLRESARMS
ncbi:phage/plasmid primase, P4 family [Candidatus Nitronereus thalassa]|uniref:Phage/plasmid primase, P4 family n=1 Tax=Candidatus Nitronereus thalassa TaxID=3020898 RepID=A0ABU3K945_9BACT|nr:phage/plasmid primase, P4 family [Candidatus Nitronereus thalassa]MDT7042926.1 phage/plasmid primase, P4 family [Candidatus Nitronereus thalassa]